jgi:membrane protease YdiL (CAAX protease family)
MNTQRYNYPKPASPFGVRATLSLFGGFGITLYISTHILIPFLSEITGIETVIYWFLTAGLLVFAPMFIVSFLIVRKEKHTDAMSNIVRRLRFRRPGGSDWLWIGGSLIAIGCFTVILKSGMESVYENVSLHPPFMAFEPLGPGRYWILALWFPFWFLNIMGEEVLWRGVVLPRQELVFGRYAWMVNAGGWMIFHLAFGWVMLILLSPIIVILPYVTQKTRNTWVAVAIHAGLNGPGFIAVAFGVV